MAHKPPQRLFIPGPTDALPHVLAAQTAPMIGHRSPEFESLFEKVQLQLREMYYTEQRVYVVAASGSGLQEAAIRNSVESRVLSVVNGAFGKRWLQVAESCGKTAIPCEVEWNYAARPEVVANRLREALADGKVDAVTVVHNETSTGVMNPVAAITAAIREVNPDTLVLVDAVSSFGGTQIPFDEWGLDVCLTSSQKALALPPGLAVCCGARSRTRAGAEHWRARLVLRLPEPGASAHPQHDTGDAGHFADACSERTTGPHFR